MYTDLLYTNLKAFMNLFDILRVFKSIKYEIKSIKIY